MTPRITDRLERPVSTFKQPITVMPSLESHHQSGMALACPPHVAANGLGQVCDRSTHIHAQAD